MRLLYLTQWFDPEPGVIKGPRFVRALEAAGYAVTVVTGFPNYPLGRLYPGYRMRPMLRETIDGVSVVRLPLYPSHDSSSLRRAMTFLSFCVSALVYCLVRRARYPTVAYVYHPPITVGLAAALTGLVRRLPFVLDIQDLWPDTIAATGMRGRRWIPRLLDPVCRFVYRRAAAIIVQSAGMRRALIARGVPAAKITVVRNWADLDLIPAVPARPSPEGLTIVYGGNFGRAQALGTVIDAAALIEQRRRDIRILLYGAGIDATMLRARTERAGISMLTFHDRVPRRDIAAVFARADALLLHLAADPLFEITIPSKTQVYLAMGRPIVAGIAGAAADLLRESRAALVVPPQDAAALAEAICAMADLPPGRREAMGRDGQRFWRRHLSFDDALARTVAVLDGIGSAAAASRHTALQ